MDWLILVLASAFIWALSNLSDKFIEDHEIKSSVISTSIVDIMNAILFILVSLFFIPLNNLVSYFSGYAFAGGVLYGASRFFYYNGIKREDVSRFIPLLALIPVFVTIFSFLFLNESFSWIVYLGIGFTIVGAVFISLEDPLHTIRKFQSKTAVLFGLLTAIFLAGKDILTKIASTSINYWGVIFWLGVGLLLIPFIFLIRELINKKLKDLNKKGIKNLAISGTLKAVGSFLFTKAITIGPVALVSTVVQVKPVMVFFGSTFISKMHPEIIHEKLKAKTILQKVIATVIIIFGVILIKIFS